MKPYANNAKKHSPEQVKSLAALIRSKGWTQPIVVDGKDEIIIGHGRRLAALEIEKQIHAEQLGVGVLKPYLVPVIVRDDLSQEEVDAMRLADNRVTSTDYDMKILHEELSRLNDESIDLGSLGFTDKELEFLTGSVDDIDLSAFTEDVMGAVDDQKSDNEQKATDLEAAEGPLSDAFGFKKMSTAQIRRTKRFVTQIESETGKTGVHALMGFLDAFGVA